MCKKGTLKAVRRVVGGRWQRLLAMKWLPWVKVSASRSTFWRPSAVPAAVSAPAPPAPWHVLIHAECPSCCLGADQLRLTASKHSPWQARVSCDDPVRLKRSPAQADRGRRAYVSILCPSTIQQLMSPSQSSCQQACTCSGALASQQAGLLADPALRLVLPGARCGALRVQRVQDDCRVWGPRHLRLHAAMQLEPASEARHRVLWARSGTF